MEIPAEIIIAKEPKFFSKVIHKLFGVARVLIGYFRVTEEDRIAAGIRIDYEN
jgi:hypothetical protein